VSKKLHKKH